MFSNLVKNFCRINKRFLITSNNRQLTPWREHMQERDPEEDAALSIETNLFDNSSVKYEPIKTKDILKNSRQTKPKREINKNIISGPKKFPSFKKTRLEREAESILINDHELGIEFLKLNLNDPRLSNLLVTVRSKKRRNKDRQIVIEGRRLILEAIACRLKLHSIIFSQKNQLADIKEHVSQAQKEYNAKIYKVPHHDLKIWSTLTTPPGVMAIFDRPGEKTDYSTLIPATETLPITVVCDNIREPNNLGSIIRVCAALPCQQVVITPGCCDPWESKALRGGCGGHFRLIIKDDVDWQDVPLMIPPDVADDCFVFVAENNIGKQQGQSCTFEYTDMQETGLHNVVIIGGESHGVSSDAYRFMEKVGQKGKCLYIPLAHGAESLNVASALTLILYELKKNIKTNAI